MGKINNLHGLELEIEKMRLRMRTIEGKLDDNLTGLKENYGMMAFNSVVGSEKKAKMHSFWSNMAGKLLENPKLQNNIGKWVDKIADRLADGMDPDAAESEDEKSKPKREP
jgi:hypothetical protein